MQFWNWKRKYFLLHAYLLFFKIGQLNKSKTVLKYGHQYIQHGFIFFHLLTQHDTNFLLKMFMGKINVLSIKEIYKSDILKILFLKSPVFCPTSLKKEWADYLKVGKECAHGSQILWLLTSSIAQCMDRAKVKEEPENAHQCPFPHDCPGSLMLLRSLNFHVLEIIIWDFVLFWIPSVIVWLVMVNHFSRTHSSGRYKRFSTEFL